MASESEYFPYVAARPAEFCREYRREGRCWIFTDAAGCNRQSGLRAGGVDQQLMLADLR
jgi:hypothetical protein